MIKYLSLFSGIGAFERALKNLKVPYELVGYCETDKHASLAYSLLHNVPESMNYGDITKINETELPKGIDLITYGFPCQDISIAGNQKGFTDEEGNKTRSGLFFDAARIIKATQPKVAIAENVKPLVGQKFKKEFKTVLETLDEAGYNNYWSVLKASDFNVPQSRERVFIVSIRKDLDSKVFEFPTKLKLERIMMDYLERYVDDKCFLSDKMFAFVLDLDEKQQGTKWEGRANNDFINPKIAHTLSVRGIKGQRAGVSNIICVSDDSPIMVCDYKKKLNGRRTNNKDLRNITPKECFRLMGFDCSDVNLLIENGISNTQLYKMAGNSIVVTMLEYLFCEIFDNENNI